MMNNTSGSCSRQVAQSHKELRLLRQKAQLLQGQLEQKRKMKQHYRAVLLGRHSSCRLLRCTRMFALGSSTTAMTEYLALARCRSLAWRESPCSGS